MDKACRPRRATLRLSFNVQRETLTASSGRSIFMHKNSQQREVLGVNILDGLATEVVCDTCD